MRDEPEGREQMLRIVHLEQIRAFLEGSQEIGFEAASASELYEWTKRFLCDQEYASPGRASKGPVEALYRQSDWPKPGPVGDPAPPPGTAPVPVPTAQTHSGGCIICTRRINVGERVIHVIPGMIEPERFVARQHPGGAAPLDEQARIGSANAHRTWDRGGPPDLRGLAEHTGLSSESGAEHPVAAPPV